MSARVLALVLVLAAARADAASLADAQALFYNGRYAEAGALAQTLADDEMLPIYELRTSVSLFQISSALKDERDRGKAYNNCVPCRSSMERFLIDLHDGQSTARAALKANPKDPNALFFLGKLDLNYVWLVLGTLGRRTGWNEYWEARHSLDTLLTLDARHVRGRVARAWIDYIVDTRMPWGTAWMLGGGNKRKALKAIQEAAESGHDVYVTAEANFGLWEMQVREGNIPAALTAARLLTAQFPENRELEKFIDRYASGH